MAQLNCRTAANAEQAKFEAPKNEAEQTRPFIQLNQASAFQLIKDLDPSDFKVFFFLTMRAYGWDDENKRVGDGIARASGTFIAKGTGLSEATAEKCLGRLKEKDLISKSHRSFKWGNTYCVKPALLKQGAQSGEVKEKKEKKAKPSQPISPTPDAVVASPSPNQTPQPEVQCAKVNLHNCESSPLKVPEPEPLLCATGHLPKEPKNEFPKFEGTKNYAPNSPEIRPLAPQNLGTNIESRYSDLSLKLSLTEIESYFSNIRAPMAEKKERACLNQIQKRNPDVTDAELLECFKIVSETKDSKGQPVAMKCLWLANGFDSILGTARQRIQSRKRREEEKAKLSAKKETVEQEVSPEEAERAKEQIRAILGRGLFQSQQKPKQKPSETDRRAFLLAQAKQIEQIGKFGSLQN